MSPSENDLQEPDVRQGKLLQRLASMVKVMNRPGQSGRNRIGSRGLPTSWLLAVICNSRP